MHRFTLRSTLPLAAIVAASAVAACASATAPQDADVARASSASVVEPTAAAGASHAIATLRDAAGDEIGTARFTEDATGTVHLTVHVRGVSTGLHGLHLHQVGACVAPAFTSAGGHLNPGGKEHGHQNPAGFHAGDLPNVTVNAAGVGMLSTSLEQFSLAMLADADGTALVLHANEDDLRTNTGASGPGNSGARVACGVVQAR